MKVMLNYEYSILKSKPLRIKYDAEFGDWSQDKIENPCWRITRKNGSNLFVDYLDKEGFEKVKDNS